MYNKNEFSKDASKKILRKVGKIWRVISIVLLIAFGGALVSIHASANTVNSNSNSEYSINTRVKHYKTNSLSNSSKNIQAAADDEHANILLNNANRITSSVPKDTNYKQNITKESSLLKNSDHYYYSNGYYDNLNYKYYPYFHAIDFYNGNLKSSDVLNQDAPSDIYNARSITFNENVKTSDLNNASNMFADLPNLYSISFASDFGQYINNSTNMFANDPNLRSIEMKYGMGQNISDANGMFKNDFNLDNLVIPYEFGRNIHSYNDILQNDNPLYLQESDGYTKRIPLNFENDISSGDYTDQYNPHSDLNISTFDGLTFNIKRYNDSSFDVEITGGNLFNNVHFKNFPYYIHSLKIDSDVNTINLTNANNMFSDLSDAVSISLPRYFGCNISDGSNMFRGDVNLASLIIPYGFGNNLTNASGMFADESLNPEKGISSIVLPPDFGYLISDASGMFDKDQHLNFVQLPNGFGDNISDASEMFSSDSSLTSINLPNDSLEMVHNASDMFAFDSSLRLVKIPSFSISSINGNNMFFMDVNLSSLTLPRGFDFNQGIEGAQNLLSSCYYPLYLLFNGYTSVTSLQSDIKNHRFPIIDNSGDTAIKSGTYTTYYNPQVSNITIHYINGSDDSNEVDEESDKGYVGTHFDLQPYMDDIPSNYQYMRNPFNGNSIWIDNSTNQFTSYSQNIYIHVTPINSDSDSPIIVSKER